jgi:hypothetical protein
MFWKIMKPKGGGDPTGPIAQVITKTFGNFKDFQAKFNDAGTKQFGSGWVWLAGKPGGDVHIMSTPNQDNPITQGHFPIFGNDVWEHAYYLKYNNRRPEYLAAWWNVINWDEVNARYEAFKSGKAVHEPAMAALTGRQLNCHSERSGRFANSEAATKSKARPERSRRGSLPFGNAQLALTTASLPFCISCAPSVDNSPSDSPRYFSPPVPSNRTPALHAP